MEVERTPLLSSNLKVKTAWLYHVEGLTQEQIAEKLQISRVKVMRLLAACVEEGVVVTTINRETSEQVALERALEKRWGLKSAIVVPTPAFDGNLESALGHAVAEVLDGAMADGKTLAIGGGATLFASLKFLTRRKLADASVVSLVGSMPYSGWINPSSVAVRVAEIYGVDSYQITAPVLVDDPALTEALWRQPPLQEVKRRAAAADIALLTVGGMGQDATIFRYGLVGPEFLEPLRRQGAVANILSHFIDAEGRLVDHELNERILSIDLDTVARIPLVVLAAGGAPKFEAIRAAMKAIPPGILITDAETAKQLLAGD